MCCDVPTEASKDKAAHEWRSTCFPLLPVKNCPRIWGPPDWMIKRLLCSVSDQNQSRGQLKHRYIRCVYMWICVLCVYVPSWARVANVLATSSCMVRFWGNLPSNSRSCFTPIELNTLLLALIDIYVFLCICRNELVSFKCFSICGV